MLERILVVDDEPLARERVRRLVLRHAPRASIHESGDGAGAVAAIRSTTPQAVFLDVEMPGGGGLEVVNAIGVDAMPPTIFVTAHDEHALAAFNVAAVDYLLKPFEDARFAEAWTRLERRHAAGAWADDAKRLHALLEALLHGRGSAGAAAEGEGGSARERLVVRDGERTIVLPLADVSWVEASGNHVLLHVGSQVHRVRDTLTNVEARLDPARFARIHRRFIVALAAIRELRPWSGGDQVLVLRDGAKLPVSRNYRSALAARLRASG